MKKIYYLTEEEMKTFRETVGNLVNQAFVLRCYSKLDKYIPEEELDKNRDKRSVNPNTGEEIICHMPTVREAIESREEIIKHLREDVCTLKHMLNS